MIRAAAPVAAMLALVAACRARPRSTGCDDDLQGVYVAEPGAAAASAPEAARRPPERWMVLDSGPTLEAYPLFPDAPAAAGLEVAPRVIDLARRPDALAGTLRRRYMQQAASCEAQLPVHVTRCAEDALELVLADPQPPLGVAPCAWPARAPSRVVRWRRE